MTGFQDLDGNGLKEVVVGSPGYNESAGAVYILFMRRRRFHPPIPDVFLYYFKILFPIFCIISCCCGSCGYFFWYFRRKPDEIEVTWLLSFHNLFWEVCLCSFFFAWLDCGIGFKYRDRAEEESRIEKSVLRSEQKWRWISRIETTHTIHIWYIRFDSKMYKI